jgi:hypothetical protein
VRKNRGLHGTTTKFSRREFKSFPFSGSGFEFSIGSYNIPVPIGLHRIPERNGGRIPKGIRQIIHPRPGFPMHLTRYLLFCTVACVTAANGFEIDGYHDGMSRDEVKRLASKYGNVRRTDADTLLALTETGTYASFNFCQDRLVSVQQGHPATFKQLSRLVARFNKLYGQPMHVQAVATPQQRGELNKLDFWWKTGDDYAKVTYIRTPTGDDLSTAHQARNACFEVPR